MHIGAWLTGACQVEVPRVCGVQDLMGVNPSSQRLHPVATLRLARALNPHASRLISLSASP